MSAAIPDNAGIIMLSLIIVIDGMLFILIELLERPLTCTVGLSALMHR